MLEALRATRGTGLRPALAAISLKRPRPPEVLPWSRRSHGRDGRATVSVAVLLVAWLFTGVALGSTSTNAPLPQTALGNEPLRSSVAPPSNSTTAAAPASNSMDYLRVLCALGIVIALIFLLRWCGRVFFPSAMGRASTRVVEVLSRSVLTPKQQVMLLRVGRRLIIVGDSGSQLSTLCQIDDPDEVAGLVGQLRDEKIAATTAFGSLFGRFHRKFESPATEEDPPTQVENDDTSEIESTRSELDGLKDRVRQLAQQFG